MAATNIPFVRGRDVQLKLYQNGRPVVILVKNWEVSEEATEAADGVNGEDRDRLDKVTNFYSVTFDVYETDTEVIDAFIAAQEADDAAALPLRQTLAVQKRHRNGTKSAYLCQEAKVGPWKNTNSSRQDNVMFGCKARFRYWKKVPTI